MRITPTPPNPVIMQAVEGLGYRATVGDVATHAGLDLNLAQQGLLALAAQTGGHLQVAESGEVVYQFPQDFRDILRQKFWQIQLQEWWQKVWRVLFYLIRLSFGGVLILLIVAAIVAIFIAIMAMNSSRDENDRNDRGSDGGGGGFSPGYWWGPNMFGVFDPSYNQRRTIRPQSEQQLNFLEAIFSFLFGDGNPNANLEERRWQTIGTVIRNHKGAVIAEQIAPYLDQVGTGFAREYEDYMLPVLTRFDGRPEVSPAGQIIYHFPNVQTTVNQQADRVVAQYLAEQPWQFSQATGSQIIWAIGLGGLLLGLGLTVVSLSPVAVGGLAGAFIKAVAILAPSYSIAYLTIPLVRYFWLQGQNRKIAARNADRSQHAQLLNPDNQTIQEKLTYAQQFAAETVIQPADVVYTTERDLVDQELERADQIDTEWQARLNQSKGL
jgi:hypothetical protein